MFRAKLIGRLVEVPCELSNDLGVATNSCVRKSCAAGGPPACAGVDVSLDTSLGVQHSTQVPQKHNLPR